MVKVIISEDLKNKVLKKFKQESKKIFRFMRSLEENPKKGKIVGQVKGVIIKEIKYQNYRFYFITDGYKLKVLDVNKLRDLVIKFVRMSNKKAQQKTINEIKVVLRKLGDEGF